MNVMVKKVQADLYLTTLSDFHPAGAKPTGMAKRATNHIVVIDCSGSMSSDLPKLREQLKLKLTHLLEPDDTFSVIWFSGRGESGILLLGEQVTDLHSINRVQKAIDRWIQPVGMTGFREPLELVREVVENPKLPKTSGVNVLFMSDGCDNQCLKSDILEEMQRVAGVIQSFTVVEYGLYADRAMLSKLAEIGGGTLVYADGFDAWTPVLTKHLERRVTADKPVMVRLPKKVGDVVGGVAWTLDHASAKVQTFEVKGGCYVSVSGDVEEIAFLSTDSASLVELGELSALPHLYTAASLFATRAEPKVVRPVLAAIQDKDLIESFGVCFGKQAYTAFQETTRERAFNDGQRFPRGKGASGYNPKAFCLIDLLNILSYSEENTVLIDSEDFQYSRIGRRALEREGELTFKAKPAPRGVSISNLTWNETRPNVSILVKREGLVELGDVPKLDGVMPIPSTFPTFIHRNYTVIRDGLRHLDRLPVRVNDETMQNLISEGGMKGKDFTRDEGGMYRATIDLRAYPIMNEWMTQEWSAKDFFKMRWDLAVARCRQKVLNTYVRDLLPSTGEGFRAVYGERGAEWLKVRGLTEGGFSPARDLAMARDVYIGVELDAKIRGVGSLPSVAEVLVRMGKPVKIKDGGALLMSKVIEEVEAFRNGPTMKKAKDKDRVLEAWLKSEQEAARREARSLIYQSARASFGIVVGQGWFTGPNAGTRSQGLKMELDVGLAFTAKCSVELKDVEVEL